jgi:PAS domain S-box-containing protein
LNILIVNSVPTNLSDLSNQVKHAGHLPVTAESGERAIEKFNQGDIDFILMDVEMESVDGIDGIDGMETARQIRGQSDSPCIPIIFLHKPGVDDHYAEGLESGGGIFLTKPVNPIQLANEIQAMTRVCEMKTQLQQGEIRMRAMLESVHDVVMSISLSGIIKSANPAFKTVFGKKPDDLIGQHIDKILETPTSHDDLLYFFEDSYADNERVEMCGHHEDGHRVVLEASVSMVATKLDTFFTVVLHDITDRKQAEAELNLKNKILQEQQEELDKEAQVAKKVFEKITANNIASDALTTYLSPMCTFNGDILMSQMNGDDMYVLLGDFTGHGLPAAIGAIPLVDTFKALVAKGFSANDIFAGINNKLNRSLPIGIFCCAVLLVWNKAESTVSVHNAALPNVIVTGSDGIIKQKVISSYPPLGIMSELRGTCDHTIVNISPGDHFFVYTDGINEAEDTEGNLFSIEAVEETFTGEVPASGMMQHLLDKVIEYRGSAEQSDDISLIELTIS